MASARSGGTLAPTASTAAGHRGAWAAPRAVSAPMPMAPRPAHAPHFGVRCAAWVCAVALSAFAHTQAAVDILPRALLPEVEALLSHPNPVVRGEAALLLAARGEARCHDAIVAIACDDDDEACVRGLLALGVLATPGAEAVLEHRLADLGGRQRTTSVAAAYALGSLPSSTAAPTIARVLVSTLHGSQKRQRPMLSALLLGMAHETQTAQLPALRQLLADDSVREPAVRAQLLGTLLPAETHTTAEHLRRTFTRGSDAERVAMMAWLATDTTPLDAAWLELLKRQAEHGSSPELRCAALAALTRVRHVPALEIAARALQSADLEEASQGLRSVLTIGGAAMRGSIEAHVRGEREPARQAALLRAYQAPPGRELAELCARTAADGGAPPELRAAAAALLARSDADRAAPLLRDLFRSSEVAAADRLGETLPELARLLLRGDRPAPSLDRLLPRGELVDDPSRWRALVLAGHPEALHVLVTTLGSGHDPARLALALRLWRQVLGFDLRAAEAAMLPAALQGLFGA